MNYNKIEIWFYNYIKQFDSFNDGVEVLFENDLIRKFISNSKYNKINKVMEENLC